MKWEADTIGRRGIQLHEMGDLETSCYVAKLPKHEASWIAKYSKASASCYSLGDKFDRSEKMRWFGLGFDGMLYQCGK
jgi:hypothetical protein